jgi:hypothetical protein
MKTGTLKFVMGVGMVLGVLAVMPAQAGNGTLKITHASTPYVSGNQAASKEANTQPKVNATKASEVQVAVMASAAAPSQPGAKRSIFIHR